MTGINIVLTTCPSTEVAESIARKLVDEKLAACVNIISSVQSIYKWKGEMCAESECLLLIKTSVDRTEELKRMICEIHPYELPEVVVLNSTDGLKEYFEWVNNSVKREV